MKNLNRQLARYLSLARAVLYKRRALHILSSLFSLYFASGRVLPLPLLIQIEPTNRCNLFCILCAVGLGKLNRVNSDLSFDAFSHIVDQLQESSVYLVLYNFGESLLNDDVYKMIGYAKKKRIYVRLSTNGQFSDPQACKLLVNSGVDELIVSLDFPTPELYLKYKGIDGYWKVIKNVESMILQRGQRARPYIRLQLLLTRDTEEMISCFKSLARDVGVDGYIIKKARIDFPGVESNSDILPRNLRYIRRRYVAKETKKRCYRPWLSAVILSDGSVLPCCFDVHGEYSVGNIFNNSFKEIWNNQRYCSFRSRILRDLDAIPLCRQCSISKFLDNFVNR